MKKKLLALILALVLALSLAACGSRTSQDGSEEDIPEANTPEGLPGEAGPPQEDLTPEDGAPAEPAPQEDVDLVSFYDTLLAENEWPELMALEGEMLDGFYPGLSGLSLKQCVIGTAAISAAVGELSLVEVEDAGDAQTVADIFQDRIDYQVGDDNNPGGAWYPASIEGWKNESHIAVNGNYVMLAVGSHAAEAAERFQALFA